MDKQRETHLAEIIKLLEIFLQSRGDRPQERELSM